MLQIITCKTCGKSGILPYELNITFNHRRCKSCGDHKYSSRSYMFCSEECLREFMKRKDLIEPKVWELGLNKGEGRYKETKK